MPAGSATARRNQYVRSCARGKFWNQASGSTLRSGRRASTVNASPGRSRADLIASASMSRGIREGPHGSGSVLS